MLAVRGFNNDNVQLRASALTFYSILSIVPLIAIAFAIAKGFSLDQNLEVLITKKFHGQPDVLNWVLQNATNAIKETKSGPIAGVGVIMLFWSVMALLDRIESSFNHIWRIRTSRPWFRKFTDYLAIMLIAPVFIILSSSIKVFIGMELAEYMVRAPILDFFKPVISGLVKCIPYLISWLVLTVLFMILPNTKVKFVPAFISAVIAGTILQILQMVYLDIQFGITRLSAIYGSFAAVPLLLILLQSSWIVVLLGAELSFANQNFLHYDIESVTQNISNYQKKALMVMVLHMIIRNFSEGEKPVGSEAIANNLNIPIRLSYDILQDLANAKLVSVLHEDEHKERLYQPALDINKMTLAFVFSRIERRGISRVVTSRTKNYNKVTAILDKFDKLIAKSDSNILIRDL